MYSDKHKIDKLIKERIGDHEMMPDDDLWNSIEASVAGRSSYRYIYKCILIAAVVGVVCMGIFKLITHTDTTQSTSTELTSQIIADTIEKQTGNSSDYKSTEQQAPESNTASHVSSTASQVSKEEVIKNPLKNDPLQAVPQQPLDTVTQPEKALTVNNDTSTFISIPEKKTVVKKVVKKPVYIIQQDTIYKIDSLKRRKIK